MVSYEESPSERLLSWAVAIAIAIFFLPGSVFLAGTVLLSLGIGLSNATGLPLPLSWALVAIYLGVAITTIIRVRASRMRRLR